MRLCQFIIFFIFVIAGDACAQSKQQIKADIDRIIGDPSDILYYGDFAYYPPFIKLMNQKENNFQSCVELISDPATSLPERIISIMLLNKISAPNYILFSNKIFDLYRSGRLSEEDLYTALFPERPLIDVITNNYKLPSERVLLSRIILCHCVSKDLSHLLFDVLTGRQYKRTQEFYRECCTTYKFKIW